MPLSTQAVVTTNFLVAASGLPCTPGWGIKKQAEKANG